MGSTERIDDTDRKIIEILSENARISLRDIKKSVKLSPSSIKNRMENLVNSGVIKRYTVELDHNKMGLEIQVLMLITVRPGIADSLFSMLSGYKQVYEILRIAGPASFILIVRTKDINELTHFITGDLEKLDGIDRIETMFILPSD